MKKKYLNVKCSKCGKEYKGYFESRSNNKWVFISHEEYYSFIRHGGRCIRCGKKITERDIINEEVIK